MSDPTMQGTPLGTDAARYSLAEIDAVCRKAARGAGCPWGLAEEAGKAARWLAARALPGPEALAALLDGPRDCPCAGGTGGPGCALRVGTALGDRAERITTDGEAVSVEVAQPLLVLAQLGRAATATGATFVLEWPGVRVSCGPDGFALEGDGALVSGAATLRCAAAGDGTPRTPADCRSRPVARDAWTTLERYAARTCAPATEASRRSGAGAGSAIDD